jgi:dTDP-4-amino-4,6-dideoxygalactose transaminase
MTEAPAVLDWPRSFPGVPWFDEAEEQAVTKVMKSRSLFRYYGPETPGEVDGYEAAAREYYGAKHAIGVGSGTGALVTAMQAMGIGPGAEVIVPSFLWLSTAAAAVLCNAIPVICEVDESFTMDPADLERKITPRTKLIAPIHMCGAPCDMTSIMEIANRHGIPVLEDCAQCNGGSYHGRKVGTIGQAGIFSLQLNKNMTTGEGGLLITSDDTLAARAFAAHDMGTIRKDGVCVEAPPELLAWGGGRRMGEIVGAIARVQLSKLDRIVAGLRKTKAHIKSLLADVKGIEFRKIHDPAGDTAAAIIMMLPDPQEAQRVADGLTARGLRSFRLADFGMHIYSCIPALVRKVPLSSAGNPWSLAENRHSVYDYSYGACPRSDALFERSILLQLPSKISPELQTQAAAAIADAVRG